jgi:hypothetical protein
MSIIVQRTGSDCAICCMAMLTGRSYEDVLSTVGDAFDPERGMREEQKALDRLGFRHEFERGEAVGDMVCTHRGYAISPEFYRSMAWGRRALMSVPSLNSQRGWHMIYFDGATVFDPSPLKRYTSFDELRPDEIVLFQERPLPAAALPK